MTSAEYQRALAALTDDTYVRWCRRLRGLRLSRGWSQQCVAARMVCSRSQYAAIEYGHSMATYTQICQLALAFDLPLSDLMSLTLLRFPAALVRYAKEVSMPRPKGSRVITCLCHARIVGMPGERKKCACGRRYTLPTTPHKNAKAPLKKVVSGKRKRGKAG
jgi:transcriptional regulator with XRE-family HTH domain